MIEAAAGNDPVYYAGIETMLTTVTAVFSVLIGFSAVIAGVGLVTRSRSACCSAPASSGCSVRSASAPRSCGA